MSLVVAATRPLAPSSDRPTFVSAGREADVKRYREPAPDEPPLMLADARVERSRTVGVVGTTRLDLVVDADAIARPRGGYVVVLEAASPSGALFPGDLVHVPEGATLALGGRSRVLVLASDDRSA